MMFFSQFQEKIKCFFFWTLKVISRVSQARRRSDWKQLHDLSWGAVNHEDLDEDDGGDGGDGDDDDDDDDVVKLDKIQSNGGL